ncbi:MAG: hypothetical protein OMM_00678 [Candidatus Magnetoglobus multicellularis str. Araruama]|uniref:AttH domain-containing protein n=1 Tax=Candidatus Magnetoglobus multicellularis str. Araruama TaxID=890399 RepID=A0A1V1PFZ5_9BACT|nr:MAG: hypothetical protein OMM_00678 [Candidatus Magnetoglobus multicellularis str. Araruama]
MEDKMPVFSLPFSWPVIDPKTVNNTRYAIHKRTGHYESYFLRANHPDRPLALWIRFTIFSPENKKTAIGEVWAIYFDGETGNHVCAKTEIPIEDCIFYSNELNITLGDAKLDENYSKGRAMTGDQIISWDIRYDSTEPPLFLLQRTMYDFPFPKAKTLVGKPFAKYSGTITINGIVHEIDQWIGSQNHNWGVKHSDHYAWGQVAGFDNYPETFFEVVTARLQYGPIWSPFMTIMVLRHGGKEYRLNSIPQSLRAKGSFGYFEWHFLSETPTEKIEGSITAERDQVVGLNYYNPPGGVKHCLNTKLGSCEIQLTDFTSSDQTPIIFKTDHRAAFEILTTDYNHGIPIRA